MPDVVLDTNVLADFLVQYFGPTERGKFPFTKGDWLTAEAARLINRICEWHQHGEPVVDLVVASAMAFVELTRKWDEIMQGRLEPHQLAAFLRQPPEWFSIAPVDEDLAEFFCEVPTTVSLPDGALQPIELTDAVHVATVFSRDPACRFATTDFRLRHIHGIIGRLT